VRPLPWLKEETAFAHSLPWTLEARTLLSSSQVYPRATKHNQDLNPSRSPSCSSTLLPLFLSHSSTIYSSQVVDLFVLLSRLALPSHVHATPARVTAAADGEAHRRKGCCIFIEHHRKHRSLSLPCKNPIPQVRIAVYPAVSDRPREPWPEGMASLLCRSLSWYDTSPVFLLFVVRVLLCRLARRGSCSSQLHSCLTASSHGQ
jgi:hypothetical protein